MPYFREAASYLHELRVPTTESDQRQGTGRAGRRECLTGCSTTALATCGFGAVCGHLHGGVAEGDDVGRRGGAWSGSLLRTWGGGHSHTSVSSGNTGSPR